MPPLAGNTIGLVIPFPALENREPRLVALESQTDSNAQCGNRDEPGVEAQLYAAGGGKRILHRDRDDIGRGWLSI